MSWPITVQKATRKLFITDFIFLNALLVAKALKTRLFAVEAEQLVLNAPIIKSLSCTLTDLWLVLLRLVNALKDIPV